MSSAFASPCWRVKASVAASRRVLSAFSTAPAMGTPKWASSIAGVFGSIAATDIAGPDAARLEGGGEAPAPLVELAVAAR